MDSARKISVRYRSKLITVDNSGIFYTLHNKPSTCSLIFPAFPAFLFRFKLYLELYLIAYLTSGYFYQHPTIYLIFAKA